MFGGGGDAIAWIAGGEVGLAPSIIGRAFNGDPYVAEVIAHEVAHHFWADELSQDMKDEFLATVRQPKYAELAKEIFPTGENLSDETMGTEAYAGFYARLLQLQALGLVSNEDRVVFERFYPWVSPDYFTMALGQ
jgi:hypothetical protein